MIPCPCCGTKLVCGRPVCKERHRPKLDCDVCLLPNDPGHSCSRDCPNNLAGAIWGKDHFTMTEENNSTCSKCGYTAPVEHMRPSTVYKPKLFIDGDEWCALFGENIQDGVAGFGKSPAKAMYAFDCAWEKEISPAHAGTQVEGEE